MEFLQGSESFPTRGSFATLHSPKTWDNIRLWSRSWLSCMFSAGVGVGSWFSKLLESDFQKVASRSRFLNSNNLWDGVGILKKFLTPQRWKWRQTRIKGLSEVKIYIYIYIVMQFEKNICVFSKKTCFFRIKNLASKKKLKKFFFFFKILI